MADEYKREDDELEEDAPFGSDADEDTEEEEDGEDLDGFRVDDEEEPGDLL